MVINKVTRNMEIWELTVSLEANINERNRAKNNKYGHYALDLSKYNCKLTCFEISSKGFITDKNPR